MHIIRSGNELKTANKVAIVLSMFVVFFCAFLPLWNIGSNYSLEYRLSAQQEQIEKIRGEERLILSSAFVNEKRHSGYVISKSE